MEDNKNGKILSSILEVSIPEYQTKEIDRKIITMYTLNFLYHFTNKKWTLKKQYSEFESLHRTLIANLANVPEIPKKALFKITSEKALQRRTKELEGFIKECIKRRDILTSSYFSTFISIDQNAPELLGSKPNLEGKFDTLPLAVRDFHYSNQEKVLFIVCSEISILSRTDTRLTNLKMPWETENSQESNGNAYIYTVNKENNEYKFNMTWSKEFSSQPGMLYWDEEYQKLCIGLDDGNIYLFQNEPNSNFSNLEEIFNTRVHKDKIMGLSLDNENKILYSVSSDKSFNVTNYSNIPIEANKNPDAPSTSGVTVTEIKKSNSGYTNLIHEKKNKMLILSNETGEIEIYSTNNSLNKCEELTVILCKIVAPIKGMYLDVNTNNQLYICNILGTISQYDLSSVNKGSCIKEYRNFGTRAKLQTIKMDSRLNCLVTADDGGRIIFWDIKTGEPLYSWMAHLNNGITQVQYDYDNGLLWTGGKDKCISIWKLPDKWELDQIEEFKNKFVKCEDNIKSSGKYDSDSDSDKDELNGWNK